MSPLEELLVTLVDSLPATAADPEAALSLEVDAIRLAFPIESGLARDGVFRASAPRGRMLTGFDPPHGALTVVFVRGDT